MCFVPMQAQNHFFDDSDSIDMPVMVKWGESKISFCSFTRMKMKKMRNNAI